MSDRSQPLKTRQNQLQESLELFVRGLPRGMHLTAPEVYKLASDKGIKVSLSTVYRSLNNLQAQGQVQALGNKHGRRYESAHSEREHDHLICVKCGLTVEFEDDLIKGFGRSLSERKGFEYGYSRFDILGLCQPCRLKGEDHRVEALSSAAENSLKACRSAVQRLETSIEQVQQRKFARAKELMDGVLDSLQKACAQLSDSLEEDEERGFH